MCLSFVFCTYVVEKGGVSVAVLEASGPALIVHCVCQWLVKNQVSAEFVARIPDDPLAVVDAGERVCPSYGFAQLFDLYSAPYSFLGCVVYSHSKSVRVFKG